MFISNRLSNASIARAVVNARRRCLRSNSSSSSSRARPPFDSTPNFRFTEPPHPSWKLGQGLPDETPLDAEWRDDASAGWKAWETKDTSSREMYKLLTSAVVPRPIAFVSTLSSSGVPNLAPFSYFSLAAHNPPTLTVSFSSGRKDTRDNIASTREFTVNLISEPFVEAANSTAIDVPADVDEWALSGLTPEPNTIVKPPRVRESAVAFECVPLHTLHFGPSGSPSLSPSSSDPSESNTLVLGHILAVHVRRAVLSPDELSVDPAKLRAISRLGGTTYARIGEGFELKRLAWKRDGDELGAFLRGAGAGRKGSD